MKRHRPPDILRKSHPHSEGNPRARERQELRESVDETLAPPAREHGLLIDLDGVVYRGDEPIEGAADSIRWLQQEQIPHLFVTNTTSRPPEAIVDKLAGFGIDVMVEEILAPPRAAADWLKAHGCRRLLLAVTETTAAAFAEFETLTLDAAIGEQKAAPAAPVVDAVVVGDLGAQWTFERLNAAFRCLMQKPAPHLIALGMTRYWRAPEGLRLDTAPFVAALATATGISPTVLGKPAKPFFETALQHLNCPPAGTWMIGDDIRTDVGAAQEAGLFGVLVRTGKFSPADLDQGIRPNLIIDSFARLPAAWAAHAAS